jgi:outer membrane protein
MEKQMRYTAIYLLTAVLTVSGFAQEQAAGAENQPAPGDSMALGLGVTYKNALYRGDDSSVFPIPLIMLEKGQFFIKGRTAGYRVYQDEQFAFDVIGQWRFDGYDDEDSDYLDGMDDRDMTLDGGAAVTIFDGWGRTTFSMVSDLLSKHSGQELSVTYSKTWQHDKWSLTPSAGVRFYTSSLGDYYYGVQPDEAVAGRGAYDAGDSLNPFAGLSVTYNFNEKWSALTSVRYTWLDSEITDSPIVDDRYDLLLMTGLLYTF